MCGVCVEIQNPSLAPSLYAAGFAGVATGGRLYLRQLRNGVALFSRADTGEEPDPAGSSPA